MNPPFVSRQPAAAIPAVLSEKRLVRQNGRKCLKTGVFVENSRTTHLGPFGEVIRATGPMAKVNPFMFSTKFYDWEAGPLLLRLQILQPLHRTVASAETRQRRDEGGPNLLRHNFVDRYRPARSGVDFPRT